MRRVETVCFHIAHCSLQTIITRTPTVFTNCNPATMQFDFIEKIKQMLIKSYHKIDYILNKSLSEFQFVFIYNINITK